MARVALVSLEQPVAGQIHHALAVNSHQIIHYREQDNVLRELSAVDIVFAGGEPADCLRLLKRVRKARPTMPFIVVTRNPETSAWLDALEAGATDYCSAPIGPRQLHWMMERAQPAPPRLTTSSRSELSRISHRG
jgi:DNA-binding response OmpR family regulator